MGFFEGMQLSRLKQGLAKTRDSILGKLRQLVSGKNAIDEEALRGLEEILLSADVGPAMTSEVVRRVREQVKGREYENAAATADLLCEEVQKIFSNGGTRDEISLEIPADHRPQVIMVVGVNGVGKTTTIGKLAHAYKTSGKSVLIAAADTFRAAANEQLEIWAKRAGVDVIQQEPGADPAAVAFDALKASLARQVDVMIVDTAGRLHTKVNLMDELRKIKRVLQKQIPEAPHEVLLVLDASIGQNAIQQARQFGEAVGVTGLVMTKLDGTARGGVVLSINRELNIPVKFIGVGENIDDLQPFNRQKFVEALLARE